MARPEPPPAAPPVQPSQPVAASAEPLPLPPAPAPAPASIAWQRGVAALERAREEGRPVMACFLADWSASSIALARRLEASEDVRRAASKVVAVTIDLTDTSPRHEELAARYAVDHIPLILVFDARGETARLEGEIATDALVEALQRVGP